MKNSCRFIAAYAQKLEAPANESGASSLNEVVFTTSTHHFRYKMVAITAVMGINGF